MIKAVHVGDSIGSDIKGAESVGIRAFWLNRSGREVPPGVEAVAELTDLLAFL